MRGDEEASEGVWLPVPAEKALLAIQEVLPEDLPVVTIEGRERPVGMTLASMVAILGDYSGRLSHPITGQAVYVSLEGWRGRDPENVWLMIVLAEDDHEE